MLRHPVRAFSPLAPRWLAQVMASNDTPVPWAEMVRHAVSVTVPVLAGFLVGDVALAGLLALGAWLAASCDGGGAFVRRGWSMGVATLAGVVGMLLGTASSQDVTSWFVVLAVVAAVSAVMSAVSADLSNAGLQLLIYFAIGAGPLAEVPPERLVLASLAGAGWALAMSWVLTLVRPQGDVPRRAVAAVLDALLLVVTTQRRRDADGGDPGDGDPGDGDGDGDGEGDGDGGSRGPGRDDAAEPATEDDPASEAPHASEGVVLTRRLEGPRAGATAALAHAYDAVVAARSRSVGPRRDLDRLAAVLDAANGVAASLLSPRAARLPDDDADVLVRRIEAVRARVVRAPAVQRFQAVRHPLQPRYGPGEEPSADERPVDAATTSLERAAAAESIERSPWSGRWQRRDLRTLVAGPTTRRYALRLITTLLAAQAVALLLPVERSYWVLMTAALVLKPDFGSVFARGLQRVLGTAAGAALGAMVLVLTPDGPWIVLPVAVLGFLLPLGDSRNYGLMSTFLTPLVLVFVELSADVPAGLVGARVLDSVIGAGVVLLVGYLAWPGTWRSRMPEDVATLVDALADYAAVALTEGPSVVAPARRRAQGALTDARARLQAALAEPTRAAQASSAWFPLITSLGQAVDDLRDVSILAVGARERGVDLGGRDDAAAVCAWLGELAAAVRAGREPADVQLPSSGPLADVAEDLRAARRTMVGHG